MQLPGSTDRAETEATTPSLAASSKRSTINRNQPWSVAFTNWLGFVPFALFCLLFEILPAVMVIEGSFADSDTGAFTWNNYQRIFSQPSNLHAFQTSISLSLVTAVISAVLGFFAAYGLYQVRANWVRNIVVAFSSIAANFAGVPLAFAFISTLGVTGFVTVFLLNWFHIDLYHTLNFSVYSFWGLVLTYSYFELPLMILITLPALDALRPEWREAATSLGASNITYWFRIALPILFPSLIAAAMLLFANAFAAFATAYALAQGAINLVPILISFVVNGNVNIDTGLGDALAVGMIVILLVAFSFYTAMLRRVGRWQGR
ncbi:ABC transporter [Dictyobacter sp. S3.2.2.5]|uniref:ABC transporter n=1 Tax=Dictyobacter halimunensis TaxID=3026934 RepID=A0ABQ6FK40_9CHLR|nr:ABC transporter [Dictyobacter sp. S3.2.2.5]